MSKPKILVADDDRMLRALLSHKLKALGCDIVATENGKEALEVLENESIDLVILDGMMPIMDGTEALQRMRANPKTADLPVIMLTARRREEDAILALEMGATDYISKPFNPDELMIRIRRWLNGSGQNQAGSVSSVS
ncbi:response regulator [Henriciella litoralis]|uniref:response regulator n=1 Tax=Henriciella litoralis TaxID=568102 RepID=UPI000A07087E|nr:response regulator [Henriciella litoralis]